MGAFVRLAALSVMLVVASQPAGCSHSSGTGADIKSASVTGDADDDVCCDAVPLLLGSAHATAGWLATTSIADNAASLTNAPIIHISFVGSRSVHRLRRTP